MFKPLLFWGYPLHATKSIPNQYTFWFPKVKIEPLFLFFVIHINNNAFMFYLPYVYLSLLKVEHSFPHSPILSPKALGFTEMV